MSQALGASNQMLAFSCIEESRAIAIEVIEEEKEEERLYFWLQVSQAITLKHFLLSFKVKKSSLDSRF